jgi:VWFA-related protein
MIGPWFGPLQQSDPGDEPQVHITQVDTSQFPTITVYVSVTDANGEPVGIDPGQITLSENGAPITIQSVGGEGEIGPLTTLLVMDVSGSMNEAGKLDAAKAAARTYVEQMRPGDQAGLLVFNTEINYVQSITTDREVLTTAIESLKASQDTAMYDALAQAVKILEDIGGRKAVIALTDGLDNRSLETPDGVIEQIGPSGLSISTVGLGDPAQLGVTNAALDEAALKQLAERAGGAFGYANDPDSLRALYEKYGRALQSEYILTYTSPSTLRDGVNRSLGVSLSEAAQPIAVADYNPGGLVPEVPQASWPLFAVILAGLLILLVAPVTVNRLRSGAGFSLLGKRLKKSRIKLVAPPARPSRPRAR